MKPRRHAKKKRGRASDSYKCHNRNKANAPHYSHKPKNDDPHGCKGKRRYSSLEQVLASGDFMAQKIYTDEVYLYHCSHCNGYHLTKWSHGPDGSPNRWVYNFGKGENVGA